MTVIIKDLPEMTGAEILDALRDIRPDQPVSTGHGGFVVDEKTALEFLRAYLIATGRLVENVEPVATSTTTDTRPAKRGTSRKGVKS